jgi:hypothetical protein
MKILIKTAAAAGLLALAACSGGADDNKAEAIEANAENVADNLEAAAENTSNDQAAEALEDQAEATREAGDEKADAVDSNDAGEGKVESNVSGM